MYQYIHYKYTYKLSMSCIFGYFTRIMCKCTHLSIINIHIYNLFLTITDDLKKNPYYLSQSPGNGYLLQKNELKTFV